MAFMPGVPDGVNVELFIVIFMALLPSWGGGLNEGAAVVEAPDHGLGADVLGALVAAGAESPAAAALSGPVGVKPDAFGLVRK
jgi:hypothetical protein